MVASKCPENTPAQGRLWCFIGLCLKTSRCQRGRHKEEDVAVGIRQNYGRYSVLESLEREDYGPPREQRWKVLSKSICLRWILSADWA
jgi:hypothetical protein